MHPCTNTTTHNHTHTHFIRLISLIWWTHVLQFTYFISILSIPNVHPSVVRPITDPCTTWSGTFYSFASDEPYAHFLVDHSYLTCLYLPFDTRRITHMSSPPEFRFSTYTLHHIALASHHFTSRHTTSQSHHLYLLYHAWRQSLTPKLHPQSHIGFILRSLLHPRHIIGLLKIE